MPDGVDDCAPVVRASARPRIVMVVAGAVSLLVLSPVLRDVYSSFGTAVHAQVGLAAMAVGCSALGFASTWALQRLTLRLDRWSDVAVPQLAGNAASNVLPAGSAFGLVIQLRLLRRRGVDLTRAVTSLTISGLVSTAAGLCVFPLLLVVPVGADTDVDLGSATRAGLVALAVCVPIVVLVLRSDRTMRWVARGCHRAIETLPRCRPPTDLADRIVRERDAIRDVLWRRKGVAVVAALGRGTGEYLALYASLLAVGLRPSPPIVLAAFVAGNAAGMVPFTPGGLGFVEAGLSGILVLSGAAEEQAVAGVAIYRLATTWLPVLAGVVAYLWSRRPAVDRVPVVVAVEPASAV